jgi:hypothetical protein
MSCYFERTKSDFPEFDRVYNTVLLPENPHVLDEMAAYANFNIYHHDLWNSTGRRFAEMIIRKCIEIDKENPDAAPGVEIAKYFGIQDDTNI